MDRYIIQFPDIRLYKTSREVTDLTHATSIVKKMEEIAFAIRSSIYTYPRGFEMAAPQMGEFLRIIILQGDYHSDPESIETVPMINVNILQESEASYNWEDCLSVKDMRGYVKRCKRIRVRYAALNGETIEEEFQGDMACDIQHGVDHLDGKLFFERDMKYLIPLSLYRSLKEKGIHVLNEHVKNNFHLFNSRQHCTQAEMTRYGLRHPRQSLPIGR